MKRVFFWLLFPFVLPQALYVRHRAPRSPGAGGPVEGRAGSGQSLSVLIVGDSLAAGVGAATLDQALAGHTGTAVARRLGRHVRWKAVGRSGASSHEIAACSVRPATRFDGRNGCSAATMSTPRR